MAAADLVISHLTLQVADLGRAEAFYAELGFQRTYAAEPEGAFNRLLGAPEGSSLGMVAMEGPGLRIELLRISTAGAPAPQAAAACGLRHLAIRTDDLDRAAQRILAAGGAVHADTRVKVDAGEFMMAADPDGARLLLMQVAAAG